MFADIARQRPIGILFLDLFRLELILLQNLLLELVALVLLLLLEEAELVVPDLVQLILELVVV